MSRLLSSAAAAFTAAREGERSSETVREERRSVVVCTARLLFWKLRCACDSALLFRL